MARFRVGAIMLLSVMLGAVGISMTAASLSNVSQREQYWNDMLDDRLLEIDTILSYFVNMCNNNPSIQDTCITDFNNLWDSTCEKNWDKIDACKRIEGYLIARELK